MSIELLKEALRRSWRLVQGTRRWVVDGWVTEDLRGVSLGIPELRDYPYRRIWP